MASALAGHRVVVTRAAGQADDLMQHLAAAGATPIALPTIRMEPPSNPAPLAHARHQPSAFQGFVFTSVHAVAAYLAPPAPLRPAASWVCAVGPATAAALAAVPGWTPDIVPVTASAEGVLAALAGRSLKGQRLLFPRSAIGRDTIPAALTAGGVHLTLVEAYQTVVDTTSQAPARALFPGPPQAPGADSVVFTSGSTARHLAILLGAGYRDRLQGVALAALGSATRATLEEIGLECAVQAPAPTAAALITALAEYWHARTSRS